jgi:DNA-binding response OmpR family regulator
MRRTLRSEATFWTGMDMLTKPFALDALGAKVRAMIEG